MLVRMWGKVNPYSLLGPQVGAVIMETNVANLSKR